MHDSTRPLLGSWVDRWLRSKAANGASPLTVTRYQRTLDRFVADMGGPDVPLDRVTALDYEEWVADLRQPNGRAYRPTSRKVMAAPVQAFWGWAHHHRLVDTDPTAGTKIPAGPKGPPKRLPREAVRKLIEAAPHRERVQILLMVVLGLRLAEVAGLRVEDWDRERGLLTVHGKGGRTRILPVVGELEEELGGWVRFGLRATTGPMWPSPTRPGEPLGAGWSGRQIAAVGDRCGVRVHPHLLRHTAASDMVEEGWDLGAVQAILGHASLSSTTIYVSSAPEHLRDLMVRRRRYAHEPRPGPG
jgi:site-specific recombinase XerD